MTTHDTNIMVQVVPNLTVPSHTEAAVFVYVHVKTWIRRQWGIVSLTS